MFNFDTHNFPLYKSKRKCRWKIQQFLWTTDTKCPWSASERQMYVYTVVETLYILFKQFDSTWLHTYIHFFSSYFLINFFVLVFWWFDLYFSTVTNVFRSMIDNRCISTRHKKAYNDEIIRAVGDAIEAGYRHFDGASFYANEVEVGRAIRQKMKDEIVDRKDLFVVSKVK